VDQLRLARGHTLNRALTRPNADASKEKSTVVYYESIKPELKTRPINECRFDEKLKTKAEESMRLAYYGLLGELEHPKIKVEGGSQERVR
jgi:hypothetical protein